MLNIIQLIFFHGSWQAGNWLVFYLKHKIIISYKEYSSNVHNNIDITVSLHSYYIAIHHCSQENSGR